VDVYQSTQFCTATQEAPQPGLSQEVCMDRAPARARERKRTRKYLDSVHVHVYEHVHVHGQGSIFHSLRYSLLQSLAAAVAPTLFSYFGSYFKRSQRHGAIIFALVL
jgi:hypothetical protein